MKLKDKQQTKQIVHEHTQFLICLQPHFYKKKKKKQSYLSFWPKSIEHGSRHYETCSLNV